MQTLTKIVDIISDVVAAVNRLPVDDFVRVATTLKYNVTLTEDLILWVGAKVLVTNDSAETFEGVISVVTDQRTIIVTMDELVTDRFGSMDLRVQYLHGHYMDIMQVLAQWAEDPDYKNVIFPLIILKQDIEEEVSAGFQAEAPIDVFVCTDTKQEFTAAQRYPVTFTPILYPIYQRFMLMLERSKAVRAVSPKHTKIDRLFWGRESAGGNTANKLNDFIDAIELKNIEIKILTTC